MGSRCPRGPTGPLLSSTLYQLPCDDALSFVSKGVLPTPVVDAALTSIKYASSTVCLVSRRHVLGAASSAAFLPLSLLFTLAYCVFLAHQHQHHPSCLLSFTFSTASAS